MTDIAPAPTAAEAPPLDLRHPSLYVNRELSWLEFNRRVLHEALDPRTPLLERLKFLGIYSSNLDEFFQVRVAGLKRQVKAGYTERTADGLTADEQLARIAGIVREQLGQHRQALSGDVLPGLAAHGARLVSTVAELPLADRRHLDHFFQANVFPVLTPLAVDPGHPFPYISNLSLSMAVVLRGQDGEERFARVKVPKLLPRWVPCLTPHTYVPLEQVIGANLEALFPGVEILGWHLFRITRNTDIQIDDSDEADDLLSLIQEEVRNRRFAEVTRLEVHSTMPAALRQLLLAEFNEDQEDVAPPLTAADVYEVHGLLDTADLLALSLGIDLPHLKDPPFHAATPHRLAQGRNVFEVLREGDVLLHHPYDSFATTVERFLQAAADDPEVLAIKLTLYRTG
ncbi:MAG: RNA degradosome polyphosphate kinase, partial [Gemmatimonadales bacterium]|nr:RNA degradosome polyphosphate kinase [Gemmatimonadales bacterium]